MSSSAWIEMRCNRSGRVYYKNEATGLCSFSTPEGGYRTGNADFASMPTRSNAVPARSSYSTTSSYASQSSYQAQSSSLASRAIPPAADSRLSQSASLASSISSATTKATKTPHVAILYYSMYGHVRQMALAVKKGLEAGGCQATLLQVPETLPAEVLAKMGAPPKAGDAIAEVATLPDYDGLMFGIPGRFGMMPAQMKTFWDATGSLWMAGKLVGKPAGVFVSTGTQGGGQETIGFTFVSQLAHHGMNFVSLGYRDPRVFDSSEAHGASPYGAGCLAGPDGSRQPSKLELGVAETQGKSFAEIVAKLAA